MIALLLALAGAAQINGQQSQEAARALAECAVPRVQALASGSDTPEAIADAALAACAEPQARIRGVFVRMSSEADADEALRILIAPFRARLMRIVNERRGTVARQENESTAWGDCIRAKALGVASRREPGEALADLVLQQCAAEEAAVRARFTHDRDAAAADRIMPSVIVGARNLATRQIQQARAAR